MIEYGVGWGGGGGGDQTKLCGFQRGGGGAGNALSSQPTVHSAELENRVFLMSRVISKRFVFCFAVWLPGAWNSLFSTHALQETCCLG